MIYLLVYLPKENVIFLCHFLSNLTDRKLQKFLRDYYNYQSIKIYEITFSNVPTKIKKYTFFSLMIREPYENSDVSQTIKFQLDGFNFYTFNRTKTKEKYNTKENLWNRNGNVLSTYNKQLIRT